MLTHRSFPSADVWLHYDRGFRRKTECSPVPLDWGSTDLEVFHQSYTSSNVLQPAALYGQSFRRSGELPWGGEAQGFPSAAVICSTWNSGHCTNGLTFCRHRQECPVYHRPHHYIRCSTSSHHRRSCSRFHSLLLSFLCSCYLWFVAVCRLVLHHFLILGLFQLFCTRPYLPRP